ncbi:MAG: NAD(P)H-binding protein [Dongiaceae bacterium]
MRILVTGAHGFLGSHIAVGLVAAGHQVVGAGRDLTFARRILPQLEWIACDFNSDTSPETWRPRLKDIDAVVNTVGVLQATRRDRLRRIHVDSMIALYEACRQEGVRRFVQISALGIETADTDYARTKRAGDEALAATDLDWVILRASLVIGRGSYGGTALMRGLAGLPGLIPLTADGGHQLQPILMRDFVRTVVAMVGPGAPSRAIVPVAGPVRMTLKEVVLTLRQWLGFGPVRTIAFPVSMFRLAAKFGDAMGWLGVPTAFRTTSIAQMEAGSYVVAADQPRRLPRDAAPLRDGLFAEPATVEDRWHARLYFLKPLLRTVLGLYWLYEGVLTLILAYPVMLQSWRTIEIDGADAVGWTITIADPFIHIAAGLGFLLRRWVIGAGLAMLALLAVNIVMSFAWFWLDVRISDHLWGWLLSIWKPFLVGTAILVVLAIERER